MLVHTPIASLIAEYISALATAAAVVVGSSGLWVWRQKLTGETEHELARRLLTAVYKVRERIKAARSPMITGGEFEAATEEADIEEVQRERGVGYTDEATRAVYDRRWRHVSDAMTEVNVEALEAEAVWGEEARDALQPLRDCFGELFALMKQHVRYTTQDRVRDQERAREIQERFWGIGDEDELGDQLDEAVDAVDELARPYLKLQEYKLWPFS